jgi:transcriptional regulator with XRE-family HTH domain
LFENLRTELKKRGISLKEYAEALGITERALRYKLSGRTDFTLSEIERTAALIGISNWKYLFRRS